MRQTPWLFALLLLLLGACGDGAPAGETPPTVGAAPTEAGAAPSVASPAATVQILTAEAILQRSDEAMAKLKTFRVESRSVPLRGGRAPFSTAEDVDATKGVRPAWFEQSGRTDPQADCAWTAMKTPWYSHRSRGALAFYTDAIGATGIANARIDKILKFDGKDVWVITYQFRTPSVEGPYDVFRREWVTRDRFQLLRVEQYDNDPFGSQPYQVIILRDFDQPPGDCPSAPRSEAKAFEPLFPRDPAQQ